MVKEITQNNSETTSTCTNPMMFRIVIKKLFVSCLKQLLNHLFKFRAISIMSVQELTQQGCPELVVTALVKVHEWACPQIVDR